MTNESCDIEFELTVIQAIRGYVLIISESLDIARRHMAALTWDAMFKSRRAAILADGGLFDSVAVWRPAEVGCSVPLFTVVITRVCRKSGISSVFRNNNLW